MNKRLFLGKLFLAVIMFVVLVFSGCFSPWKDNNAKIILVLNGGGSDTGRAVAYPPDDDTFSQFEHIVALSGISENLTLHVKGEKTIEAIVTAGLWDIAVETYFDGEIYAIGSISVDLQPGQDNYIPLMMYKAFSAVTVVLEGTGGAITANPDKGIAGTSVTLTIQADPGYRLKAGSLIITPEITLTGTGNTRAFILPEADVTITGEFEKIPLYTVTVAEGIQNGTITAVPESGYEGTETRVTLTIQADPGYRLKAGSLIITPEVTLTGTGDTRTFILPNADVFVTGEFEEIPVYTVTVAEVTGGSIEADSESGYEGTTITLTIKPDDGYRLKAGSLRTTPPVELKEVVPKETDNTRIFTFTMPDENVTVTGEFEIIPIYTVTIVEGIEYGAITADPESGYEGITITLTIQPDDGCRLKDDSLTITPQVELKEVVPKETDNNTRIFTFTLPDANVTVTGEFEEIPFYTVTIDEGIQHGSIEASPQGGYEGTGTLITLTITPDSSYRLKAGSLSTTPEVELKGTGNTRTFTMPDADVTVTAEFEEISSGSIQIEFDGIGAETINLTANNIENDIFWYQTLVVTINGEYDSYQWYLDGYQQNWNTPTVEINIYGGYEIRIHSLMAVVIKDGVPYSKELIFRVKYREG